ncbi:MAG: RecB family exonuclease, partial [Rhizobacter sp.]
ASFARFAPRYVEWLHGRDRSGALWQQGEVELVARPAEWAGIEMHGVIDRVDRIPQPDGGALAQLIDYKAGNVQRLRDLAKTPQEDTQLAFYAALMAAQPEAGADIGAEIGALYLPLDESGPIKEIVHIEVEASGRRLVAGIGNELERLRAGAPLPALGEGAACGYCEARGLCRRDQWQALETVG